MRNHSLVALALGVAAAACGDPAAEGMPAAPDTTFELTYGSAPMRSAQKARMKGSLPGILIDERGRDWMCFEKARGILVREPPYPTVPQEALLAPTSPGAKSVDELAESLRPVRVIDGYECVGPQNRELARRIVDNDFGDLDPFTPGSASTKVDSNKGICCGNDNRVELGPGNVRHTPLILSEVGCTANFIHPSVAITAAHCLYDTVNNAWLQVAASATTTRFPFYREAVGGGAQPFPTLDCYWIDVSLGFKNSTTNSDPDNDYAYINFEANGACPNGAPGASWFGTWVAADSDITSNFGDRAGYPQYVNTAHGPIAGPGLTLMLTSLNSSWGANVFVNGRAWAIRGKTAGIYSSGRQIRHFLDASGGDSGSAYTILTNGFYYGLIRVSGG